MSAVLQALDTLNDRLIAAEAIGAAFDLAGGDDAPAWVLVYRGQIEAISAASDSLEMLLRKSLGATP